MLSTSKNEEATSVGPVAGAWSLLMGTKGSSHHWLGTAAGPISLWGTDGYHLTPGTCTSFASLLLLSPENSQK